MAQIGSLVLYGYIVRSYNVDSWYQVYVFHDCSKHKSSKFSNLNYWVSVIKFVRLSLLRIRVCSIERVRVSKFSNERYMFLESWNYRLIIHRKILYESRKDTLCALLKMNSSLNHSRDEALRSKEKKLLWNNHFTAGKYIAQFDLLKRRSRVTI